MNVDELLFDLDAALEGANIKAAKNFKDAAKISIKAMKDAKRYSKSGDYVKARECANNAIIQLEAFKEDINSMEPSMLENAIGNIGGLVLTMGSTLLALNAVNAATNRLKRTPKANGEWLPPEDGMPLSGDKFGDDPIDISANTRGVSGSSRSALNGNSGSPSAIGGDFDDDTIYVTGRTVGTKALPPGEYLEREAKAKDKSREWDRKMVVGSLSQKEYERSANALNTFDNKAALSAREVRKLDNAVKNKLTDEMARAAGYSNKDEALRSKSDLWKIYTGAISKDPSLHDKELDKLVKSSIKAMRDKTNARANHQKAFDDLLRKHSSVRKEYNKHAGLDSYLEFDYDDAMEGLKKETRIGASVIVGLGNYLRLIKNKKNLNISTINKGIDMMIKNLQVYTVLPDDMRDARESYADFYTEDSALEAFFDGMYDACFITGRGMSALESMIELGMDDLTAVECYVEDFSTLF